MALDKLVADAFVARKKLAGAPGLVLDLLDQGYTYDRKTVAASMKQAKSAGQGSTEIQSDDELEAYLPVSQNVLQQDFSAQAPSQKRANDTTYPWTAEGWLHLAVIIDLFPRLPVGWALAGHKTADLAC